ncbi:diaminopimelate epimerase [Xylanibacter muris]|uniref:Diaminopimelate epimerase n=1 Tax=Xylanibacter muris TaxID=2736290 RepID=A0ABX2AJ54_9BACT|nr:diaminopimelate epimerase [Xylanibacter muris]NPD91101.1 diaminopimelate epimerase [Xylanibacter muris]
MWDKQKTVWFTKMHGAGNDYIYVDTSVYEISDPSSAALKWSSPHTGIGSDGLVLIEASPVADADFAMRIFNADGSEAMMCGNAARCIGKYLYDKGITDKTLIRLYTPSGIKNLLLHVTADGKVDSVTVDMQQPVLCNTRQIATPEGTMVEGIVEVSGVEFKGTFVSMGNPHFVIFTDDVLHTDINLYGNLLEHSPLFPERCNIEFSQVMKDGTVRTRVWERGSGITMACGTGACAVAVAAALTGRCGRESIISMDGGRLKIAWSEADNHVYMTGPAEFVFEGEIPNI